MPREITTHHVNGLNERITLEAMDAPGARGASHKYRAQLRAQPNGSLIAEMTVEFQRNGIAEGGFNGMTNEVLLAIVRDRLEGLQQGPLACVANGRALAMIKGAQTCLHGRTIERTARGVEGTHQP